MFNIITSLSPDLLADDMVAKIKKCWIDPFVSPVIVFADSSAEQWFRLHWLQKCDVSMNLRTERLESFVFDALKTDDSQSLLAPGLLRDVIIQKLLSTENGVLYVDKIKDNDNIATYLNIADNTNNINYKHLFDFANDLAWLFMEYEATRTSIDDAITDDDWQKDLYNAIVGDGISIESKHYFTCFELAQHNKKLHNGRIVFAPHENQNVFVFGFVGMGQAYRNILKELGAQSDVYLYLQKPKDNDNNNILLKHWAQFGNTNHRLFDAQAQTTHIPESGAYSGNTILGKIQNAIANDTNIDLKDDDTHTLTITGAPSKIKEMEIVHSAICKLLKDNKKNVTLKDILVLAPDIEQYKSEIIAVFNQTDESDTEYPSVPVSIVNTVWKNSLVIGALETLYSILKNGGLTRKTFYDFTQNPIIQNTYKISDNDVSDVFGNWIKELNVYRVHEYDNKSDDWQNAVNSLLIAKLTDKTTVLSAGKATPFSDFNTEDTDNDWLAKFVHIFWDIKNRWVGQFKNKTLVSASDIENMRTFLTDLLASDESMNSKMVQEQFIWNTVNHKLEQYIKYLGTDKTVPLECLMLSLIDVASNVKFDTGAVFTRGVTFASLMHNRILPDKYVFIIGLGSNNFPGTNNKIVLDRRTILPQNGDDDIPARNKNAFLCQLMATRHELHLSYVDKDLQTGETFYPSCVLDVLTQYTKIHTTEIGIDETRDWPDLFTPRERRNKQIYQSLCTLPGTEKTADASKTPLPTVVSLTDFRYFIQNPLKCYVSRVFGYEGDDMSGQELESMELNTLNKSILQKGLVKTLLRGEKTAPDDFKDLLPGEPFDVPAFNAVKDEMAAYIQCFKAYNRNTFGTDIEIKPNYPININLKCDDKISYALRGEILMCAVTGTDVVLYVLKEKEIKERRHEIYALVAQIAKPDQEYTAHIVLPECDNDDDATTFRITKQSAEQKLNEIYKQAFIEGNKKYIPSKTFAYFAHMKDTFMKDRFMPHKQLLNPDTDLGFTKETFTAEEYKKAYKKHSELINDPTDKE